MRQRREWFPGATYHIMQRGIRRMTIFQNEEDYQVFLALLQLCLERYGGSLHSYCLMPNHYHLLYESGVEPLWKFMKYFAQGYAMYYNRHYGVRGHLFEARYKAVLVKEDAYFLQSSRYIHLNPVKAHIVSAPEDYLWSSYRTFMGINLDRITTTERVLAYFPAPKKIRYRDFIEDIGHKYQVDENLIHKQMEVEEEWLPW